MLDLLEAIFHAVVGFFRVLYRLLFNPVTEFLFNILDIFDLFKLRKRKRKKD